ncbi:hypothetical protein MES4922_550022 [Mesorhizobium ventifaucium]|uniref:Uncharacterized protein n=1 Tax=Mesorhizobium ventifaucium TaxID=666020 RepID=A0ABM9EDA8_9HYPH|nr:hypothetical protein MES4922_550022 [Mesorhizobium ventifaucium]
MAVGRTARTEDAAARDRIHGSEWSVLSDVTEVTLLSSNGIPNTSRKKRKTVRGPGTSVRDVPVQTSVTSKVPGAA